MSEDAPNQESAADVAVEDDRSEATVTRTRKVPLAVMPVTPFGKYNLIGKLGHGGMAEVFLAYVAGPAGFRKLVVIKRLHQQLEEEPGFLDMFMDEARLAARLNHPNIVQCFEVGDVLGSHFIAMEYLEGQGLDRIRRHSVRSETKIPERLVIRILVDALEGLHYAHQLKDFDSSPLCIVHRDVSPQNVFVTYDGMVKLLDFGIAKATTHVVETRTGVVKGKFAYMAPEQARGSDLDHRADLWSMGVVLWEALANRRLFKGQNDLATLNQALVGSVPDIKEFSPDTPEDLVEVTRRSLARDANERYQNAREMKKALELAAHAGPGLAARNDVAEFVRAMFGEVLEQHRKVLQVCLSDASVQANLARGMGTGTTTDLRMTPGGGVDSVPNFTSPLSTPTGQMGSPVSNLGTPYPQTGSGLTSGQHQDSGWLGKIALLGGAVVLAVLSTFLVLMFYGPKPVQQTRGVDDTLASRGASTAPVPPVKVSAPASNNSAATPPPTKGEKTAGDSTTPAGKASQPEVAPTSTSGQEGDSQEGDLAETTKQQPSRPSTRKTRKRRWRGKRNARWSQQNGQKTTSGKNGAKTGTSAASASSTRTGTDGSGDEANAFGYLTLDTMPWSHVSINGRNLGTTPIIRVRVPVGSHKLTLRNPEQNIATTYGVSIKAGKTTTRRLGLR
jgi:serine/threonine-protein kinase